MRFIIKLTKYILKRIIKIYVPDFLFRQIPDEIIIEPTNVCNLKCPVCPTTYGMDRKLGFMEFDLFKNIIDDLYKYKKKPIISMNFAGEPMLNKEIYKFVDYAHINGFKTFISTNVTAINEVNSEKLIKAGLSSIHLCVDGFSNQSHDTYRIGSDFKQIKKNIETFLNAKKKYGTKKLDVSIQTLITSLSIKEKEDMIVWAKKIGADSIYFKSLSMGSHTTKEIKDKWSFLLPEDDKYKRKQFNFDYPICNIPRNQSVVYWNGNLGLCCIDYSNDIKISNIKKDGYVNTLFSKDTIEKRKKGFKKKYNLCNDCSLGNADYMGETYKFNQINNETTYSST